MAVVQISRIQVRRGKASSGTGIPQLASGELAWALDTQELYIGNGAVAEGSPAVGNTKILTELDLSANGNVLTLIEHIYKIGTSVQTGPSPNDPVKRSLQARFDDRVTLADFGAIGDNIVDDTAALQRAIDQLFLNTSITKSSDDTPDGVQTRVTLQIPPGIYKITDTIYIPSYATIVGAGADKTILSFTNTGPMIQFVNDSSTPGNPSDLGSTGSLNQPRQIILSGLTALTNSFNQPGMILDAVKDSLFNDLIVKGDWGQLENSDSKGIVMNAVSAILTTEKNVFNNVIVTGFTTAVYAKQDIISNTFSNCRIYDVKQGFVLGDTANGSDPGEQYGPRKTLITNCQFGEFPYAIKQHAVFINRGSGNTIRDCKLINVGNDSNGVDGNPVYPQMYFESYSNYVEATESNRVNTLSIPEATSPYIPELAGHGSYASYGTISPPAPLIGNSGDTNYRPLFRLPMSVSYYGAPSLDISYDIEYVYRSTNYPFSRRGTIKIIADAENGVLQLVDEYDVTGLTEELSLLLEFKASILDQNGDPYIGSLGQLASTIAVDYRNVYDGDSGRFAYSYKSQF